MIPKIYSVVTLVALMCVCSCSKSEIPQTQQNVLQEEARLSPHEEVSNDMFISSLDEPENLEELKQNCFKLYEIIEDTFQTYKNYWQDKTSEKQVEIHL